MASHYRSTDISGFDRMGMLQSDSSNDEGMGRTAIADGSLSEHACFCFFWLLFFPFAALGTPTEL